ncbi:hypothetical protein LPW11_02305 [Geomonas sp. RF6]|uniref:hypothetical protein n=1 Tax=Geomonas sp. RF6 TaxID=2897342 RepID=UPI001E4E974C|nr:hypothetical protein [Geomonas sp. RF6]UFS71030.1 hypothetical protein LPW11_02305 [Geomonas sp. RF6]
MRKAVAGCLLVLATVQVAHAGHGTIEETDTAIVVEYYGDASDNAPILKGRDLTASALAPAPGVVSAATPSEERRSEVVSGQSDEEARRAARRQERLERARRRTQASSNAE